MADEIQNTPPIVEGNTEQNSVSQVTEPVVPKETNVQPQETVSSPVETGQQPTSSSPTPRLKPSEHYEIRKLRNQLREQGEILRQLSSKNEEPKKSVVEPVKSAKEMEDMYWKDPLNWALEREKQLKSEFELSLKSLKDELPKYIESTKKAEAFKRQEQEALELLFPQDKTSPSESFEDRMTKDPIRLERINSIIVENKLSDYLDKNPKEASNIILNLYANKYPDTRLNINPSAPKKAQMVSTATSTPVQKGEKRAMTLDEIQKGLAELDRIVENDSKMRFDDSYIARKNTLKSELVKRYQELSGK